METDSLTLGQIAAMTDGEVTGDPDITVTGLSDLANADETQITFLVKESNRAAIAETKAAAVIVPPGIEETGRPLVRVQNPYLAAALVQTHFRKQAPAPGTVHPRAVIGTGCSIPESSTIGALAVLGKGVKLGERVMVHPGVVIGDDVSVGDDCLLYPNVTIYHQCRLGCRVIVHSGSVIGSDGFGFATDDEGNHVKWPHVGTVQIDDDVEIGAGVTIDRGTFGKTHIRRGVRIDNLVQVAHNVVVGENAILVAQVGIAGSTSLGRNVVIGGQVGVKGHVHLADGVKVAAKSGVHNNLPAGAVVAGIPAIDHRDWLKASTIATKLPRMYRELRQLKKAVRKLTARSGADAGREES